MGARIRTRFSRGNKDERKRGAIGGVRGPGAGSAADHRGGRRAALQEYLDGIGKSRACASRGGGYRGDSEGGNAAEH